MNTQLILKQYMAATRALCIVNKLKPGPSKDRHKSRVFSNYNRARSAYRKLIKGMNL